MQFLGQHNLGQNNRTELSSDAFAHALTVDGLAPAELRWLFGAVGQVLSPEEFAARPSIAIDTAGLASSAALGPVVARKFAEGVALMTSGGQASCVISARDPRFMMPQPLGFALSQQWARSGLLALHGAVICVNGRGILALGRRGCGKSVLAASALAAGGQVVSDDWVLVGADAAGVLRGERLRGYLQLRSSDAGSGLRSRLGPKLTFASNTKTKFALMVANDEPQTPVQARINELWVLRRPHGARSQQTRFASAEQADFFAALLDSSLSELFGHAYPIERVQLLGTIQSMLLRLKCRVVETGLELASEPKRAWSGLE